MKLFGILADFAAFMLIAFAVIMCQSNINALEKKYEEIKIENAELKTRLDILYVEVKE